MPTLDEHQNTTSPFTHHVLTHPASPSVVATSDSSQAEALTASSHVTVSIISNESLRTNGVATEEQFQDQDETPTIEKRKRNVEETVTTLEQNKQLWENYKQRIWK